MNPSLPRTYTALRAAMLTVVGVSVTAFVLAALLYGTGDSAREVFLDSVQTCTDGFFALSTALPYPWE